tara:strand:+ start:499 stop:741 length:243 start_codon:yes stop_codon:yes gene_type:complete
MLLVEVEVVLVRMQALVVMVVGVLVWRTLLGELLHLEPPTQVVEEEEMEMTTAALNLEQVVLVVLDLSLSHTIIDKYLKT